MSIVTLDSLKKSFSGVVILPGEAAYERASTVLMRKGAPALIAQVKTPQDIALALRYAKDNRLVVSVRAGGHSNAGLGTNNGGLVIDVSPLNKIVVDEATGHVQIGAGAQWGNVAELLSKYGLGLSSGDTRTVGVGGLTLGGGIGWMVREYGLLIDSLLRADIVTADGQLVTADATTNPDLFWAICGGGGNFGVAVAFQFAAHPVGEVHFGPITLAGDNVADILTGWRDYMRVAPEKLTTTAVLLPPHAMGGSNPPMCILTCCWDGANTVEANAALDPLRRLGKVLKDEVAKKPYYQILEDAHMPPNVHIEMNNALFNTFGDELIAKIAEAHASGSLFQLRSLGGAMKRVPADRTAFAHRDSEVMVGAPQFFPQDATEAQVQEGLKRWRDIAAHADGAYSNFFSRTDKTEAALSYPPATYERLARIKTQYDPQNIFDQNLNIKPAG